jgi:prenyl protein peptidase
MEEEEEGISKPTAVTACTAMALLYVAILYAPTLILRLPPPPSLKTFMIRRFVCTAISSILSLLVSALILPVSSHPSQKYAFASEKIAELKCLHC